MMPSRGWRGKPAQGPKTGRLWDRKLTLECLLKLFGAPSLRSAFPFGSQDGARVMKHPGLVRRGRSFLEPMHKHPTSTNTSVLRPEEGDVADCRCNS